MEHNRRSFLAMLSALIAGRPFLPPKAEELQAAAPTKPAWVPRVGDVVRLDPRMVMPGRLCVGVLRDFSDHRLFSKDDRAWRLVMPDGLMVVSERLLTCPDLENERLCSVDTLAPGDMHVLSAEQVTSGECKGVEMSLTFWEKVALARVTEDVEAGQDLHRVRWRYFPIVDHPDVIYLGSQRWVSSQRIGRAAFPCKAGEWVWLRDVRFPPGNV